MKKLIAMLLALVMVLSLTACGGRTEAPAEQPAASNNEAAAPADNGGFEADAVVGVALQAPDPGR